MTLPPPADFIHRSKRHTDGRFVKEARFRAAAGTRPAVRVEAADAHLSRACRRGALIVRDLEDSPYGERQYSGLDPAGHSWTFSETIADVDPADWGGELASPRPI